MRRAVTQYALSLPDVLAFQCRYPVLYDVWLKNALEPETVTVEADRFDGEAMLIKDGEGGSFVIEILRARMGRDELRAWMRGRFGGWKRV